MKRSSETGFFSRLTGNRYAAASPEIKENGNALSKPVSYIRIVGSYAILSNQKSIHDTQPSIIRFQTTSCR